VLRCVAMGCSGVWCVVRRRFQDVESDEFWSQIFVLRCVAVGCSGLQWGVVWCSGV